MNHPRKISFLEIIDFAGRYISSFVLTGSGNRAFGINRHATRGAQATRKDLGVLAIFADFKNNPMIIVSLIEATTTLQNGSGFGNIKIAGGIGMEIKSEFVEIFGNFAIVIEVLVEISFTIVIKIVEASNLILATDVNDVIDDAQS